MYFPGWIFPVDFPPMNTVALAAWRWRAALLMSLLALAPAHAVGQDNLSDVKAEGRAKTGNGILTMEISFQEFLELQRLDDGDRRVRLGLPPDCSPGISAITGAISPSSRFFVLVTCSKTD